MVSIFAEASFLQGSLKASVPYYISTDMRDIRITWQQKPGTKKCLRDRSDKLIPMMVLILVLTLPALGQLKESGSEPFNRKNQQLLVSEKSEAILKIHRSQAGLVRLERDGSPMGTLPASVRVVHAGDDVIYGAEQNKTGDKFMLRKYAVDRGAVVQTGSLEYKDQYPTFFDDGSIALIEQLEGGGRIVKVYSQALAEVANYAPDRPEYNIMSTHTHKNLLAIGYMGNGVSLTVLSSEGKILFEKALDTEGELSKVVMGEHFVAAYCYNSSTRQTEILAYDLKGNLLWKHDTGGMVIKWLIQEVYEPRLVVCTMNKISFYQAQTGALIYEAKLTDFYTGTDLIRKRKDNYIETVDMKMFSKGQYVAILLSEPAGINKIVNNLLVAFSNSTLPGVQVIKLPDVTTPLILNAAGNKVLVTTDKDIQVYHQ
jgi:hypothetical protein